MEKPLCLARLLCFLAVIMLAFLGSAHSADCPPNVDPSYCAGAEATGGKIYSGTPDENFKNLQKDLQSDINQKHTDIIFSATKNDILRFLDQILFLIPALLPFIILAFAKRKIENRQLFATIYSIGNSLPPLILLVYFVSTGAGYDILPVYMTLTCLMAIFSFALGYFKKGRLLPLYITSFFMAFLTYLPILMLLTLAIS